MRLTPTDTPTPPHRQSAGDGRDAHSHILISFEFLGVLFAVCPCYLRRPPPPPPRLPPPPLDPMLEAPRLLLPRALDPLYPRAPPPKASRCPPPLRERSRPPIRSAPPPLALFPTPAPPPRLPMPAPPPRLLERLPPCRPNCCRALACRLLRESPRVVPPNLSAVARSRYG